MHLHTQTYRQALRNRVQMSKKPLTQINSCPLTQASAQQCLDMCWAVSFLNPHSHSRAELFLRAGPPLSSAPVGVRLGREP